MLLADPSSHAQIAFVPFRGCYVPGPTRNVPVVLPDPTGTLGCIKFSEMQDLTNDASALTQKINMRQAQGGYPGTNVCLGMHEGRKKLFGSQSRGIARKVMVVLTDGDQGYSDFANGGAGPGQWNLGDPTPTSYPARPYEVGSGDGGDLTGPCVPQPPKHPGDPVPGGFGPNYDPAVYSLDGLAIAEASTLKTTDPSGINVEIYVLRFALPVGDVLDTGTPPGSCDPALVSDTSVTRHDNSNDIRDRNLSRCLASNTAMGDPFAVGGNDHYFYAATAADIRTQFTEIATNILRKRRLVS